MIKKPARLYTTIAGIFLLAQGISTLAFRLYPPLDHAFPQLLALTQMVPPHSILHILTGLWALATLYWGGERGAIWFAAAFGLFYTALALYGMITMQPTVFGLQPFDHPFHLLLGLLGLMAAGIAYYQTHKRKRISL
ncbi:MAG: DUF4383 domain-containing protein [Anaerolineae bacterium]|nr:DUF4383 domain-containing protein [Anaerolineae bacterium]